MNPKNPAPDVPDTDGAPAKFRMNRRVFQMVCLALVALALPITMLILGVREMRKPGVGLAETAGLRQVLTAIAEVNLPTPVIPTDIRRFELSSADPAVLAQAQEALREEMENPGVLLLEHIETAGSRWLVKIPEPEVRSFERRLVGLGLKKCAAASPTPSDPSQPPAPLNFASGAESFALEDPREQANPPTAPGVDGNASSSSSDVLYEVVLPVMP